MIEIGVLKTAVDLFDKVLNIIDRQSKNRRELFKDAIEPLYSRLELIA